jgi:myo-inositol-1(or 4)-monophosphatase
MSRGLDRLLESAKRGARAAGELVEARKRQGYRVIRKEVRELVTEIDMAVQNQLIEHLSAHSECRQFLSEERRQSDDSMRDFWVLDPLDGTHNFVAGLPFYGISVAYVRDGEILLGVVHFPGSGELFWATKGGGAFRDGDRVFVDPVNDLEKSIVAYDNQFHKDPKILENFIRVQERVFTTRVLGVATRDACFVAEGALSARVWNSTKLCDVAAGALIVEEAGGRVTDFSGRPLDVTAVRDVVASNGRVHDALLGLLEADPALIVRGQVIKEHT